jgi:hypothetical protein
MTVFTAWMPSPTIQPSPTASPLPRGDRARVQMPLPPFDHRLLRECMAAPVEAKLRNRVQIEVANLKEATAVIVANHYLHRGRTMAQIAYWVTLDGQRCGVLLFALPRMSATFQGHGPMNLVELARMWLDPAVQGERVIDSEGKDHSFSVGTCAVAKALRRIRQDWHGKYPHLPEIMASVSWADDVHHEGTIYRASNFREVGKSGGALHGSASRPNGGHDQLNADYLHQKTAFLFEFSRPLSDQQKAVAVAAWDATRPKRPLSRLADAQQPTAADQAQDARLATSRASARTPLESAGYSRLGPAPLGI